MNNDIHTLQCAIRALDVNYIEKILQTPIPLTHEEYTILATTWLYKYNDLKKEAHALKHTDTYGNRSKYCCLILNEFTRIKTIGQLLITKNSQTLFHN